MNSLILFRYLFVVPDNLNIPTPFVLGEMLKYVFQASNYYTFEIK